MSNQTESYFVGRHGAQKFNSLDRVFFRNLETVPGTNAGASKRAASRVTLASEIRDPDHAFWPGMHILQKQNSARQSEKKHLPWVTINYSLLFSFLFFLNLFCIEIKLTMHIKISPFCFAFSQKHKCFCVLKFDTILWWFHLLIHLFATSFSE